MNILHLSPNALTNMLQHCNKATRKRALAATKIFKERVTPARIDTIRELARKPGRIALGALVTRMESAAMGIPNLNMAAS
jgi:hypothetical protein